MAKKKEDDQENEGNGENKTVPMVNPEAGKPQSFYTNRVKMKATDSPGKHHKAGQEFYCSESLAVKLETEGKATRA